MSRGRSGGLDGVWAVLAIASIATPVTIAFILIDAGMTTMEHAWAGDVEVVTSFITLAVVAIVLLELSAIAWAAILGGNDGGGFGGR